MYRGCRPNAGMTLPSLRGVWGNGPQTTKQSLAEKVAAFFNQIASSLTLLAMTEWGEVLARLQVLAGGGFVEQFEELQDGAALGGGHGLCQQLLGVVAHEADQVAVGDNIRQAEA